MTNALAVSEKDSFILIEYSYGEDRLSKKRYTNWSSDYVFAGDSKGRGIGTYSAVQEIKVPKHKYTGVFEEKEYIITHPIDDFFTPLSKGKPHSPISARVWEISYNEELSSTKILVLFSSDVQLVVANPENKRGFIEIHCINIKSAKLDIPMGVAAISQCSWNLGQEYGCVKAPNTALVQYVTVGMVSYKRTATILEVDGKTLTTQTTGQGGGLPDRSYDAAQPDNPLRNVTDFWNRGYIEKDGLRIQIRDWEDTEPEKFYLMKEPPSGWLGSQAVFTPGCNKSREACSHWKNTRRFYALGHGIPTNNPLYEEGIRNVLE